MRSKDPATQVGATIVNDEKKIVGIGYNGFPKGCSDDKLPWGKTDQDKYNTKYMYVCHANECHSEQEHLRYQELHNV